MARSKVNRVLEGKEKGERIVVRGDYVRMKIWNALLLSTHPLQSVEIKNLTDCSYEQVKSWLDAWVRHGYVKRTELDKSPTGGKRFTHTPITRSPHPPAITLKGLKKEPEHRQYIWEAMREYAKQDKDFFVQDLLTFIKNSYDTDVNYDYAVSYCRDLYNAKYLTSKPTVSRDPIYMLKYDTGYLSPSLCRNQRVFDANLGVIVT